MLKKRTFKVTVQKRTYATDQLVLHLQNRPKAPLDATVCGWNNSLCCFGGLNHAFYSLWFAVSISAVNLGFPRVI